MHYGIRLLFIFGITSFFLSANIAFAQVPARRLINVLATLIPPLKKAAIAKPKVRPLHRKTPTRVFGNSHVQSLLTYRTTTSGSKTKIVFDIDLGEPSFSKSKIVVKGSEGKQFGEVSWSNLLIDKMPPGVSCKITGKAGEPGIPVLSIMITIPEAAANLAPFVQQSSSSSFTHSFLLPRADTLSERTYSVNSYKSSFPYEPVLSRPSMIRTMRIVSLSIPLLEFTAASGAVKAKKKFNCGITFDLNSQAAAGLLKNNADPVFAELYTKMAANTSDIERFRGGFHTRQPSQKFQAAAITPTFDRSITDWIDPGAQYIKLVATRTGLYRVTAAEAGVANWRPSELRMFNKGKEVPIWIDSSSDGKINAIEYYGEHLAGYPGEYLNWDTDSNGYWLTNSSKFQTVPKRIIDKVVSGNPSLAISEGKTTLHHEEDNFYSGGDGAAGDIQTLHRFEWIPGERFVWQFLPSRFENNDVLNIFDTFMIASLPSDTVGKKAQIITLFKGISTSNTGSVTHNASIIINGNSFDVSFIDYQELRDTFFIPLSMLRIGSNSFQITYKQGNGSPDKWYFDYYSVSLPAPLSASTDTSIARGQWAFTLVPSQQQFTIGLQTNGEVPHLYNLSDHTKLAASGSVFKESANDTNQYAAATTGSFLHPARIVNATGSFAAILDTTKGADYIIITHPLFFNTAKKLESRRQLAGLRTKVVTTDDVFDCFDYGSDEPEAIRRYLQYAYEFYSGAPPAFVTLFGDGTWDPKFDLNNPLQENSGKTIHQSFVPTFGIPNSDYVFTTVEASNTIDSEIFRMVIARIPVESVDEGESYLAKLIEYETSPPAAWNKNFLFIAGGDPGPQHGVLADFEKLYVGLPPFQTNQYGGLGNPPISITPTFIVRQDLVNQIDITQIPAIQSAFKDGQSLVYFFGHGAPNITDVQFPDVGTLRNQGEYPVFITVSCRTGAFAEPNFISMNESFIRVPEAGAILAYGTTGFGDVTYDFDMSADCFNLLRSDSAAFRMPIAGPHRINFPMVFTIAKYIESDVRPSAEFFVRHNSLYEYAILGDAALGFALRPQPEFAISAPEITLMSKDSIPRTVFSVSDSEITVKAVIHNFGYGITTPLHVRITDNQPGNRQIVLIDTITSLELLATTGAVFTLDSFAVGSNTLDVFVDYDNQFAETNENDNDASVTFLVNGNSGTPFYPPEGSKYFCDIRTDSVNVILLLPNNTSGATSLEIQFDTTSAFLSPTIFSGLSGSGLFFQKAFARSVLPNPPSHVVWWRSRITLQSGLPSSWQVHSFSLDAPKPSDGRPEFSYSTRDQLATTIISGLQVDSSDGALFIPTNETVVYDVEARGQHDTNVVGSLPIPQVFINGKSFPNQMGYINGAFVPLIVLELTADKSGIENVSEFLKPNDDIQSQTAVADSIASVIAAIPTGRKVIVMTNFQPVLINVSGSPQVTSALESLGSQNGFDKLAFFGSYVLIGEKGFARGQAKEQFSGDHTAGVSLLDTFLTLGTSGIAQTSQTAVASAYGKLRWKAQNISANSTIKFKVLGIRKKGGAVDTLLVTDASSGTSADLSTDPASFYEKLFVKMNFKRDSSSALSPRLSLLELEYDPAPEFATNDSLISVTPKIILEGNPATVTYQIQNVTCVDGQNVPVQLTQTFHGTTIVLATDTIATFAGHSSKTFSHTIATTGFQGIVNLTATVNPGGVMNEQLAFNNSANTSYTVVHDSTKPKLDLLFDGNHINSGDYVSSKVTIEIRLSDNSPLRVTDSASISGVLQPLFGSAGPLTFSGGKITAGFTTKFITQPSGVVQAMLDITPDSLLKPGRYLFTAMGNDASGNRADTVSDEFVISGSNGLDHVMNYPNPFKEMTSFTFILKAASQAEVKVVIYTVAGRKIRTLRLDPSKQHAGLNKIDWDGRDEMGNDIGNGTYLYRVVLNGTNDDGSLSSDATTERAVRSR